MKSFVRNLSAPTEFCLVILICFGLTIIGTLFWLVRHLPVFPPLPAGGVIHLDDRSVIEGIILRVLPLGVVLWIGRVRGWSLATFGFQISWKWTAVGMVLFFANGLIGSLLRLITTEVFHGTVDFHRVSHITLPFVILISIVNPLFEEALECGYFFQALQRHGMWITVLASAVFRAFLHATMGVSGVVSLFANGLLFGFFYWRWRQLWPLVVAHALQMLHSLVPPALAGA